ncbi:MAG: ComEC/Rec2 family competence protein [Prevotella sp.]|nr:ComEC/Rec2 family competence protein [Prevotella sp.]
MKTNGKIQLYPLVRMTAILIIGMLAGYHTVGNISYITWLIGTVIALLLTVVARHDTIQSMLVLLVVFLLGGSLMSRTCHNQSFVPEETPAFYNARQAALSFREQLVDRFREAGLTDQEMAVVSAMTLGDKSHIDKELRQDYSRTGASHVLALSGLHLGIIYFVFSLMTERWRRRYHHVLRPVIEGAILLTIWSYVFLVGLSPSVVRAAIMITVYSLLSLQNRNKASLNTLAFTAIVMLVIRPMNIFDIGFQLSFVAVAFILLFERHIYSLLPSLTNPILRWLWRLTSVSISAQMGVAPLTAYYFHQVSCSFLLTNLVVVVMTTLIIYLSLLFFLFMWLPYVQTWIIVPLSALTRMQNTFLQKIASLPGAAIEHIHLQPLQVLLVYVIIFAIYAMIYRISLYKRLVYY